MNFTEFRFAIPRHLDALPDDGSHVALVPGSGLPCLHL
jgi:hypothetical protein